jgi:predicted site-specific integrase-resolvase
MKRQSVSKAPVRAVEHTGQLWSEPEVAIRLGLCTTTLQRMRRRGEITALRLSQNKIRYSESEILRFLATKAA